ncbi:MAG: pallilysin-related adhesin [Treponema sp.]|jgi:hypothetical protein|nr:pallilysin-related adhesin [Treponema sp.]
MNRKLFVTITVFAACALAIGVLALRPGILSGRKNREHRPTRIVIPENGDSVRDYSDAERMAQEDSINLKTALDDGEIIVSVLNYDFEGDSMEEQIVAYRNLPETESPVYITCIEYDAKSRAYRRMWSAPTAASRPGTISLYTQDLIGDRNACILLTGMNGQGEHTMTIFRRMTGAVPGQSPSASGPAAKIAELRTDGSITVQETERSLAYQQGITNGRPYIIAAYGYDPGSGNILDQTEITYVFNHASGRYEQSRITRIPGSQIEQRRLQELLSGESGVFENFINDLWYHVSPQGTLDKDQYIYFDPVNREVIFFGDETQQVFNWLNSSPTRYGLYISSQNISVTTLRRSLDIELESLESIRLRVHEDVRLKVIVSASWDGSYRRAGSAPRKEGQMERNIKPAIAAVYDSALGRLRFGKNGFYELSSGGAVKKGRYVFFQVSGQDLIELRPDAVTGGDTRAEPDSGPRQIYRIEPARKGNVPPANLTISRVRLGAMGIQDLHEGQIILTLAQ